MDPQLTIPCVVLVVSVLAMMRFCSAPKGGAR